ncbi:hypothetical protein, partial [Photorhabdus stackebrandtii]|uniref:hypothetical protein n=1 Tax=Photorhabdus stackebrandtii TaxID=1123042 RepID=UPI001F6102C9
AGYGGNADFTLMNSVGRLASLGGMSLGSLAAFPAFDAMRQALHIPGVCRCRQSACSGNPTAGPGVAQICVASARTERGDLEQ